MKNGAKMAPKTNYTFLKSSVVFGPPFLMKKRHPRKVSEMRPQRWPKGIPNGANWIQNGTQMAPRNIPMVIGLITGRKWTPKCPALPQTSPCASIRPPFSPSTSCPHRFPLGAAVSRSAYNPPPSLRGQSVLDKINILRINKRESL